MSVSRVRNIETLFSAGPRAKVFVSINAARANRGNVAMPPSRLHRAKTATRCKSTGAFEGSLPTFHLRNFSDFALAGQKKYTRSSNISKSFVTVLGDFDWAFLRPGEENPLGDFDWAFLRPGEENPLHCYESV